MKFYLSAIIAVAVAVAVVFGFGFLKPEPKETTPFGGYDVQWRAAGATSTAVSLTTATSAVLTVNGNRTYAEVCNDSPTATIYCKYGTNATAGQGKALYGPGNTTSTADPCLKINITNPWRGQLTCLGTGNATATVVEY